jgi:hypothetical protein
MLLARVGLEGLLPAWPEECSDGAGRSRLPGVESTDSVLAARLAAGDERALAEVLDAHGPAVYRAALPVADPPFWAISANTSG